MNTLKVFICVCTCALLTGCHNPKDVEIPARTRDLDGIQHSVKQLTTEERQQLATYILRHTMMDMGSGNTNVPPGTTIGQALEAQNTTENL